MTARKVFFKPEEEEKLKDFLKNYSNYLDQNIKGSENANLMNHTRKLANYLRNVILRRTGMESVVHRFGSRMIGCSTNSSDLDLFVQVGKKGY
jgi:CRISPR/Cas system-associated protein Csx1